MASFSSEHKAPAELRPGLRFMWLFGFPSICECVHNWLDNPINPLCRGNGLLNDVDHFGNITAAFFSSFCASSNFAALRRRRFSSRSSRLFLPFSCGREAMRNFLNWWTYS
jgi:hypothetical protein